MKRMIRGDRSAMQWLASHIEGHAMSVRFNEQRDNMRVTVGRRVTYARDGDRVAVDGQLDDFHAAVGGEPNQFAGV